MNPLDLDISEYPMVIVTITDQLDAQIVHEEFNRIEEALKQTRGPYVMITHTSGRLVSADTRVAIGERVERFFQDFKERHLLSIVVIKSPIARMMVKGALLLVRSKSKIKLVESEASAKKLAQQTLDAFDSVPFH
ncbi:MAG TPA: hypothetical protein DCE41_08755 [Cytophagales bacterium]|nr:hypothetical protein [Cytophagales bacterium]HAA19289.1 hypothetical protein [Cytophagales bacterium]HAP61189.1 hypothetical protein [Cytophagales bacterium]